MHGSRLSSICPLLSQSRGVGMSGCRDIHTVCIYLFRDVQSLKRLKDATSHATSRQGFASTPFQAVGPFFSPSGKGGSGSCAKIDQTVLERKKISYILCT